LACESLKDKMDITLGKDVLYHSPYNACTSIRATGFEFYKSWYGSLYIFCTSLRDKIWGAHHLRLVRQISSPYHFVLMILILLSYTLVCVTLFKTYFSARNSMLWIFDFFKNIFLTKRKCLMTFYWIAPFSNFFNFIFC